MSETCLPTKQLVFHMQVSCNCNFVITAEMHLRVVFVSVLLVFSFAFYGCNMGWEKNMVETVAFLCNIVHSLLGQFFSSNVFAVHDFLWLPVNSKPLSMLFPLCDQYRNIKQNLLGKLFRRDNIRVC